MRKSVLFLFVLAVFAFSCLSVYAQSADPTLDTVTNMIQKAQQKMNSVKDYTCKFFKQEFWHGKMQPQEIALMKFQKPHSVYMKWVGEEKKGQEVLFRRGWNNNEIKAHEGGWLKKIVVNLDPKGSMAMKGNRHPITDAGFSHTIELIAKDMKLIKDHPDWGAKVSDKGAQTIHGAASHCFEAELPKKQHPEFYAYKVHICVDNNIGLPNKVQIWDFESGQVRLVEDYSYTDIKINPGLTEKDFDPENPEYEF